MATDSMDPKHWEIDDVEKQTNETLVTIMRRSLPGASLPDEPVGKMWGYTLAGALDVSKSLHEVKKAAIESLVEDGFGKPSAQAAWDTILAPVYRNQTRAVPAAATTPAADQDDRIRRIMAEEEAITFAAHRQVELIKELEEKQVPKAMSKSAHLVVNKHWKSTLVIEGPPGVVYKDLEGMGDLSEVGDPVAFDAEAMAALEEARQVSALPPSRGGKEELMYPSLEIVAKGTLEDVVQDSGKIRSDTYWLSGKPDLAGPRIVVEVKKTYTTAPVSDVQQQLLKVSKHRRAPAPPGIKTTDGGYKVASPGLAQAMAQSDAKMWQEGGYAPRVVVLTDAVHCRVGLHTVEGGRNVFRFDADVYAMEAGFGRARQLQAWAQSVPAVADVERPPAYTVLTKSQIAKVAYDMAIQEATERSRWRLMAADHLRGRAGEVHTPSFLSRGARGAGESKQEHDAVSEDALAEDVVSEKTVDIVSEDTSGGDNFGL